MSALQSAIHLIVFSQMSKHLTSRGRCLVSIIMLTVSAVLGQLGSPAQAQVNVEQNRPAQSSGLHAHLDGSFTLIRGNVDLTQVGLSGRAEYVKGVHSPFVQASVDYGEKSGTSFLSQSFVHARWTAMWWDMLGTELFSQLQDNSFRSLILRQLHGGGVRLRSTLDEGGEVAIGLGAMFEREVYLDEVQLKSDQRDELIQAARDEQLENNIRGTSYLTLKRPLKLSESGASLALSVTLYYQPLLRDPSDYRVLGDAAIEVKLSDLIRLVESLNLLYDSEPPVGVQRYDLKSVTSLRFVW